MGGSAANDVRQEIMSGRQGGRGDGSHVRLRSPAWRAAPDPAADPGPSSQCVLQQSGQANCTSSDPEVALEDTNYGDTSECTLSAQISWGDGSQQTVQYQGADDEPSFIANHTYQQQGTFTISFVPTVLSGGCTDSSMDYTFTYSSGGS